MKLASDAGWATIGLIALVLRFALGPVSRLVGRFRRTAPRGAHTGGYVDSAHPHDPKRPATPQVPKHR